MLVELVLVFEQKQDAAFKSMWLLTVPSRMTAGSWRRPYDAFRRGELVFGLVAAVELKERLRVVEAMVMPSSAAEVDIAAESVYIRRGLGWQMRAHVPRGRTREGSSKYSGAVGRGISPAALGWVSVGVASVIGSHRRRMTPICALTDRTKLLFLHKKLAIWS
ncbi:hypothetical protein [Bradyrhizobium australiense]|uniref:Uncharacterized protein n=1 Tax=Bradyrhizobium australiense TaxID=2721161 RepID=A0A7Y4LYT8_9BRAD|nr:hypothetical protein [Bradyrhizobium australiense]NOJ43937.1 hypothetical protein [Bradyrhizobium australiense]